MVTNLFNLADYSNTIDMHITLINANSTLCSLSFSPTRAGTDLASIAHCCNERAFGLCQLLIIAAPEAESMLVGAGGAVKPAS